MQSSYPIKVSITELFQKLQAVFEPRYIPFGEINSIRIFLLANGISSKDFKFGKTEIHIRSGHQLQGLDPHQLLNEELTKIKHELKLFIRRILRIRFEFLSKREYCLINIQF